MYSTQQCSHAVSCLVINLLNFIRNGRGGMGMERSKRKEKKTKSEGDSFHWLVRTIGSTRLFAACDARNHNHPPFTYYTMAFPFFSLSFACCSITDLSTWIWFRREEEEGKKKRLQIVKVERKRERASFVVVVTRAHASRDCDSRSITERARSVNKKSIRFTEVKVN